MNHRQYNLSRAWADGMSLCIFSAFGMFISLDDAIVYCDCMMMGGEL